MIRYILTDIEGTTSSIDFVHKVLFPYTEERLPAFIQKYASEPEVTSSLENARRTILQEGKEANSLDDIIEELLLWIEEDRKHTALKKIQGMIWKEGYENGTIKGHVYPDVPGALKHWKENGLLMGVFSSGSVDAQKLLFSHSDFGNLEHYFSHHFDTETGPKREKRSYEQIAQNLRVSPSEILFLSDTEEELNAAREAGYNTIQLIRHGTAASERHKHAKDFSDVIIS
jgi:enolase-phosphatase E1